MWQSHVHKLLGIATPPSTALYSAQGGGARNDTSKFYFAPNTPILQL
jgi:hypothetical protein